MLLISRTMRAAALADAAIFMLMLAAACRRPRRHAMPCWRHADMRAICLCAMPLDAVEADTKSSYVTSYLLDDTTSMPDAASACDAAAHAPLSRRCCATRYGASKSHRAALSHAQQRRNMRCFFATPPRYLLRAMPMPCAL